ncbi:MAG TPA: PD-(D/E)XK nuclease family protein [Vicinamibacterales bacterium]|nr:PD-(D/E)XK nuclease family protein [Vicinamibacterales bacterium]
MLSQLAAVCRKEPTRTKWVLVPSRTLGHTLGERAARESGGWLNARFTTPEDLATATAAPHLVEAGINPLGEELGAPLVMRLLRELPPATPSYFRSLAEHHTMGAALWSTIAELRLAGLGSAGLKAGAFESPAKHAELQALLTAYEDWLLRERRADEAAVFRTALEHVAECPLREDDLILEALDTPWPPLVRRFIDALPGEHLARQATELPGVPLPRRLSAFPRHEQRAASPLARLMAPPGPTATNLKAKPGKAQAAKANLAFFRAGGPDAEVEEVFRRILHSPAGPRRLDEVEIACASSEYALLLWQKAERYGWPVTVETGLPGTVARPVRALLAWCGWIDSGFEAGRLRRLLASGDVRMDIEGGPGSGQAARLLLRAAPAWGRQTYALALDALAVAETERAEDPELDDGERERHARRAADAQRLRDWIDGLTGRIPEAANGLVPVQALVSAALDFVDRAAAVTNELDGQAARGIKARLEELRLLGDVDCTVLTALDTIRAALDTVRVGSDRPRPGRLHVSSLARAGLAGRPVTFIVGLQEGEVFPAAFEDPVLLDVERVRTNEAAAHVALALSADRTAEFVHGVAARLADLQGADAPGEPSICLSYSCQDLRDGRPTFASSLMLHAFRLTRPGEEVTFKHLREAAGEPASQVPAAPDAALGDAGWWLSSLKHAPKTGLQRVHEAFPDRMRGMAAEAARASDVFTEFDGLAPSAAQVLDPRTSGRPVSPTSLEKLAACPFAYFLKAGLRLDPIQEDERDLDAWLDPLTRGSLLHELFAQTMRHLREAKEKPGLKRHLAWLKARADAALAALGETMPPPSDEVFNRERDDIYRDLEVFLGTEELAAKEDGITPVGFEVGFAGYGQAGDEPLGQAEPVAIRLPGARFPLNGRIDRIDRLRDGSYQVVDYKTGTLCWAGYSGVFRHGRLLQHALYAVAAESLLRAKQDPSAKVTSGRYRFPTVKGAGRSKVIPRPPDRDLGRVVAAVLDIAAAGAFMARTEAKDKKACEYCDFAGTCEGAPVVARAGAKLDNPANEALEPWRRLQGEENA